MNPFLSATVLLAIGSMVSYVECQGGLSIQPHILFELLRGMPRDPVYCNYMCPPGTTQGPRPDHVPKYNGCGSYGFERLFIPEIEPFVECCNIHDMCYDTCGNNKNVCDMQFQYCLNQRCSQMPSTVTNQVGGYETAPDSRQNGRVAPGSPMQTCLSTARLIGSGPSLLGCNSYIAAQNVACLCT